MQERRRRLDAAHERTRRKGARAWIYWPVRLVLWPVLLVWFRLRRNGIEQIPTDGPVILAANHRSNVDPLVVSALVRRPVYFAAKEEMFTNRLVGRLLSAVGAFPVRRGRGDRQMIETALAVLRRGGCLVIFPEGTRSRGESLGRPKRGLGEIALDSGAAVVPVAVAGTDGEAATSLGRRRVRVSAGPPQRFSRPADPPPRLSQTVLDEIWAEVTSQWTALATPTQ